MLKQIFLRRTSGELKRIAEQVNGLEEKYSALSDEALRDESARLRKEAEGEEDLDKVMPRAFALAREAAKRTLSQRPFDVQVMGGAVLHRGGVAEMVTGEGKTLAAVLPAYLNALSGKGVHVVTVNEYLARRDAVWMGQIYRALGLSVACLVPNDAYLYDPEWELSEEERVRADEERDATGAFRVHHEFLRPISRREAYLADVTYGTNHEFGFDYLRDNLAYDPAGQVQRGYHYAIIDEVDSILIDEARTPLIISAPDTQSSDLYKTFARVASRLVKEEDYTVDEKRRSVLITNEGIEKVEKLLGIQDLYGPNNFRLVHYLEESLKAHAIFQKDKQYVVKDGEILIVDEFTGRLLHGRRYSGGLHQAIEAKEGVHVNDESRTYAKISIQNYFRMYRKLGGMTGTAQTSAEEFHKVYNLEVVSIPTNRPLARKDLPDVIYKTRDAKWNAVVQEIKRRHEEGQPVLVGTTSIEKNELLVGLLSRERIPYNVLNAKRHEEEGQIIAQAGKKGAITVATNIAGRGVDILLGGNPPSDEETEKVIKVGGLHVIGTERHEARRIDDQLRGRAGRQGDPGSSQFFLSLEDDLLRIFGGDRVKSMMERLDVPDEQPIGMSIVSKAVRQAQAKVEGANFDLRKHLLEYDDVLNKQRIAVYRRRQEFLESVSKETLADSIFNASWEVLQGILKSWEENPDLPAGRQGIEGKEGKELEKIFQETGITTKEVPFPEDWSEKNLESLLVKRSTEAAMNPSVIPQLLGILDMLWMNHLENLEALHESVLLRAYSHKDPLVEYREESHRLYRELWANWSGWVFGNVWKIAEKEGQGGAVSVKPSSAPPGGASAGTSVSKVGRNDPCPCGSGKKYKKCHGK